MSVMVGSHCARSHVAHGVKLTYLGAGSYFWHVESTKVLDETSDAQQT